MSEEQPKKKRKPRSKANGEGTIYTTTKNGKTYYKATLTVLVLMKMESSLESLSVVIRNKMLLSE